MMMKRFVVAVLVVGLPEVEVKRWQQQQHIYPDSSSVRERNGLTPRAFLKPSSSVRL